MSHLTAAGSLIAACALLSSTALANPYASSRREAASGPRYEVQTSAPRVQSASRSNMGGGFIEAIFGDGHNQPRHARGHSPYEPAYGEPSGGRFPPYTEPQGGTGNGYEPAMRSAPERTVDPQYRKQVVAYEGNHPAGTIIIDTPQRFLFLVQGDGTALRYGIGVGRPGFTWAGVKTVSAKREWPDWRPPDEMLRRRPDLPRYMPGGPENPLGARALYLGSSLYRIHGSNEPWTIGTAVSSGCIRMRNEDVMDLYERVKVGTRVVVI
jgi:lipoprotein-anchoring transpeptidase ErfK/SrfK